MRDLKVIVTACGCPGASTLLRMLRENGERNIELIGTDMDGEAIGGFIVDRFYRIPSGDSPDFIPALLEIAKKENGDVLFPESSNEVYHLALNREKFEEIGTRVVVSDPEPIRLSNDKYEMYEILRKQTDIELPRYHLARDLREFLDAVRDLGYPSTPVIFKPTVGKGSRGVRIIDPRKNRKQILMEEKPNSKYMSLEEFKDIFSNEKDFPELLVMEYLEGLERTADTICLKGRELLTTIKTVEQARWGVIVRGELVKRDDLVEQVRKILGAIPLSYCVNIQFIEEKLIEINPRVSTFIYQDNLIAPYLAIKLALGELDPTGIMEYRARIDNGRRMVRYMDQVFHRDGVRVL